MGENLTFTVRAVWDGEARVYYSESDIDGLYIEEKTLQAFVATLHKVAPDLIMANHLPTLPPQPEQPMNEWIRQLIPTIVLDRSQSMAPAFV